MPINFGRPQIDEGEINEVVDTLKSGWIGTGKKVEDFEKMFAEYKGVNDALAVNSGTSALHLALDDLDLKEGDEVIVPSMTFSASAHTVLYTPATLVLADCDRHGNIDQEAIMRRMSSKTKAIVVVHYTGRPADLDRIKIFGIPIIEDCAHAVEAEYKGKPVGTIGDYGCFSFYATKNLTTGDGGMIISKKNLNSMRIKANQGQWGKEVVELGYKYRMNDIQAAMGIHQLKKIEQHWWNRKRVWDRYNKEFKHGTPAEIDRHGMHLYTLLVDNRDEIREDLQKKGIMTGIHYKGLHLHPFYKDDSNDFPNANYISQRTMTLPLTNLTDKEIDKIIYEVKKKLPY